MRGKLGRLIVAAGVIALLGAVGAFRPVQAVDRWAHPQPAVPNQGAVCLSRGTQLPVDAEGNAVTVRFVSGTGARQERTPVHQITLDGSGAKINNFCLDIDEPIFNNQPYCQEGASPDPRLVYVITKYPPTLASRVEQAARQAAVWHITNGLNLVTPDATTDGPEVDAAVLAAYNAILADVEANIDPANPPAQYLPGPLALSVLPTDAVHVLPNSKNHDFTVSLTNGGKPLPGATIGVTSTFGTLDKTSGVTDAAGQVAFKLTSDRVGRASISASTVVTLPLVKIFVSEVAPTTEQDVGGPTALPQQLNVQATASWTTPTALAPDGEPKTGWLIFLPAIKP